MRLVNGEYLSLNMNHIFAFINKILYYVYLSLRPDNIEQMPEPVPDSTELLLPLILRFL